MIDAGNRVEKIIRILFDFLKVVSEGDDLRGEQLQKEIADLYFGLGEKETDVVIYCMEELFKENTRFYIMILSILYYAVKEDKLADKIFALMMQDDIGYFWASAVNYNMLCSQYSCSYSQKRKLCHRLLQKLYCELSIDGEIQIKYIPYGDRNHHNIVLMTDQLLTVQHAPSRMVLELYLALQNMGYSIMFLVIVENAEEEILSKCWYPPHKKNYLEELNGNFCVWYNDREIEGFQLCFDSNHISSIKRTIKKIQRWKPECVWFMGGDCVFPNVFSRMTTLVASTCVRGYAVSEAQILVSIARDGSRELAEMKKYAEKQDQKMVDISFTLGDIDAQSVDISFCFPENKFLIAIVGNRLEREIDDHFKGIMRDILERNPDAHFMIIGKYSGEFGEDLKEHVTKCGYQKHLLVYLKKSDIFLNPVRYGGGWSAAMALSVKTPVVTLPDCDVAANCGEAFICRTEEEIPELVWRYAHDEVFRQRQESECERRYRDQFDVDMEAEYQKVLHAVKKLAEEECE